MQVSNNTQPQPSRRSDEAGHDLPPALSKRVVEEPHPGMPWTTTPKTDTGPSSAYTIFGGGTVLQPRADFPLAERQQRVRGYVERVKDQLSNIESGSEAERNVKFQNARPFMSTSGYFSGGLMAAGYDPNQTINARIDKRTGWMRAQSTAVSSERQYRAWEIAAGVMAHDRPASGGIVNFQSMHLNERDRDPVEHLQSIGRTLQNRWAKDVAAPLQQDPLAIRSGKADVYGTRATLESLRSDSSAFKQLSVEGQRAVSNALSPAGQVIIPNVYGYPIAGHAFIPYQPYTGNYEQRPNQGLMIDLNRGALGEIKGDQDFANWAQRNRDSVLQSFNARDLQGRGPDAHWPQAGRVLDDLIRGGKPSYYGYQDAVSDRRIPARELFNYTRARGSEYQLKHGSLSNNANEKKASGVAAEYQWINRNNAAWESQTKVFGPEQQSWKGAEEFWGKTFGYLPLVGTVGNIVFGAHNSAHGMTAEDRLGGAAGAALASLQLAHELASGAAGKAPFGKASFGKASLSGQAAPSNAPGHIANFQRAAKAAGSGNSTWQFNGQTNEFRFKAPEYINGKLGYLASPTGPLKDPIGEKPNVSRSGSHTSLASQHSDADTGAIAGASATSAIDDIDANARAQPRNTSARSSIRESTTPLHPISRASSSSDIDAWSRFDSAQSSMRDTAQPRVFSRDGTRISSAESRSSSSNRSVRGSTRDIAPPARALTDAHPQANPIVQAQADADAYLKRKALNMNRAPEWLATDHEPAPQSWSGMATDERSQAMARYLKTWDPEPRRADFGAEQDYMAALAKYRARMATYQDSHGQFDVPKYWGDTASKQIADYGVFVDNQTKDLAVTARNYDDYTGNQAGWRTKPDDPWSIRKQMRAEQNTKRDEIFLRRAALDFGANGFYRLDGTPLNSLKNKVLPNWGPLTANQAMLHMQEQKANFESELYRFANTKVSRDAVEAYRARLQIKLNNDINFAIKDRELFYKRIAMLTAAGGFAVGAGTLGVRAASN